jgi:hypothetical protein
MMEYRDLYFDGNRVVFDNLLSIADTYDEPSESDDQKTSILYIPPEDRESGYTAQAIRAAIEHERCLAGGKDSVKKQVLSYLRRENFAANRTTEMLEAVHKNFGHTKKGALLLAGPPFEAPRRITEQYEDWAKGLLSKHYYTKWGHPKHTHVFTPHDGALRFSQMLQLLCLDDPRKQQMLFTNDFGYLSKTGRNLFWVPLTRRRRYKDKYPSEDFVRFVIFHNQATGHWNIHCEKPNEVTPNCLEGKKVMAFYREKPKPKVPKKKIPMVGSF